MHKIISTIIFSLFFYNTNAFALNRNINDLSNKIYLGNISLQSTTSNHEAREHFLLGVKFLHAFMYQLAIDQFKEAQKLDPGFAMSYWGEAMAYKHPIWSYENIAAAKAALANYKQHKDDRILSDKEKRYLQAANIYFSSQALQKRDAAYADFMGKFYEKYPNDPEVGAFYALSLLGLAADTANIPGSDKIVMRGRSLIAKLYKQFPQHPGIVHYFMHYHDVLDKSLAIEAVPAAKTALTKMRSSSHIAHMAAHIYRRLELWDPFIQANRQSVAAANSLCSLLHGTVNYSCNADNKYHSLEWLQYGYLITHQNDQAKNTLQVMHDVYLQDQSLPYKEWYYRMWARQILANKDWTATPIKIDPITKYDNQIYWAAYTECAGLLANGLLNLHQNKTIDEQIYRYDEIITLTEKIPEPYIGQTCRLSMFELLRTRAALAHDSRQVKRYARKMYDILQQRKSTEVTPSLSYLHEQI